MLEFAGEGQADLSLDSWEADMRSRKPATGFCRLPFADTLNSVPDLL